VSVRATDAGGRISRIRLTPRAAILAAVVTALLVYLVVPVRGYLSQRDKLADLERQTQLLQQQNADLKAKIAQLEDPDYLQRIARECLGMVGPGEISFILVPAPGGSLPASC
jgi:cell division protein FtsB